MTKQIHIDPEFRDLIPPLSADEKSQLLANVLRDGCRDPLVVWLNHGTLLDGHHRYEICEANGLEYEIVEKSFADKNAAQQWIIKNQFGRRNITPMMRAELAIKLQPLIAEKAAKRKSDNGGDKTRPEVVTLPPPVEKSKTRAELAKLAGIGERTLDKAKVVLEKATPEVVQKVRSGEMKINTAYRQIVSPETPQGVPFDPKKIESVLTSYRRKVVDIAATQELTEDQSFLDLVSALDRVDNAFSKFSRKCFSAWRERGSRPEDDSDG